ncbi:Aste57867_20121 [Aphanomyces stellatus]|uniref:Aste57867_20121 protein n=1 Tax=Aphanomyces stellatus TaxID=120398 RepID=A0A485LEU9_9STRA|nr:hypothetical protein As57867_020055 [Aphanomyces stellatus]VFT96816.1 Aste57867_20121 [Aphanomyces stellatus]
MAPGLEPLIDSEDPSLRDVDLRSKDVWRQYLPHIPLHVHDIWVDVLDRKGMQSWSVLCGPASLVCLFGHVSLQAMMNGTNLPPSQPDMAPVAIICQTDAAPFDARAVQHIRDAVVAGTLSPPPAHIYLALATASPPSISYYRVHDSLVP